MPLVGPPELSICEAALYAHNFVRLNHVDTPQLTYNDQLARLSEQWAVNWANSAAVLYSESTEGIGANVMHGSHFTSDQLDYEIMGSVVSNW